MERFASRLGLRAALLAAVFALPLSALAADASPLSAEDEAKVRAVLEEYRQAWLANDAERVLAVLATDAVLMPHHGLGPRVGIQAARAFWFPKDGPPTTITEFTAIEDAVAGSADLAYARGSQRVSWMSGSGAAATRATLSGTHVAVLRRGDRSAWRIVLLMWDDPPPAPR